jgi:hypothetical protein
LAGEYFSERPLDSFHGILNLASELLLLRNRSSEGDYLARIADVVIHEPNHFQLPDHVLILSSLVEEHEKASRDSD